jgi:glutathione S-transferase
MSLSTPLTMMGAPGSPYTRKMRALLRYRHVPYRMVLQLSREAEKLPPARVPLLPTFYLPDGDGKEVPVTDSTLLIRRFERELEGRSVLPPDPVVELLDLMLEDYGDEWLTKCMFHYRWYCDPDIEKASRVLPFWGRVDVGDEQIAPFQKSFGERQVSRLWVVGSNDVTAPVIEASYRRFLRLLDAHLQSTPFLFGRRPSAADFALYGQLTCLALFDPTPVAVTIEESPRVYAWVDWLEDLSGLDVGEDDWLGRDQVSDSLRGLLAEMGRVHVPFLLANEEAFAQGAEQVETEIDGRPWVQKPFPYQRKCLRWLREAHAALAPDDRAAADAILAGTGCEALFA